MERNIVQALLLEINKPEKSYVGVSCSRNNSWQLSARKKEADLNSNLNVSYVELLISMGNKDMNNESEEGSKGIFNDYETPSRKPVLKERSSNRSTRKTASEKKEYSRDSYTSITKELRRVLYFMDDTKVEKLSMPDKLAAAVHYIAFLENALMKMEPENDNTQECLLLVDLFGETPSEIVTQDEPNNSEMGHDAKFEAPFVSQTLASETDDNPTVLNTTLSANEPNYVIYYYEDFTKYKTKKGLKDKSKKLLPFRTKEELVSKSFQELYAEIWEKLHSRTNEIFKSLETLQNNAFLCEQTNAVAGVSVDASTVPTHCLQDFTNTFTSTTAGSITNSNNDMDAKLLLYLRRPVHFSPSSPQLPCKEEYEEL